MKYNKLARIVAGLEVLEKDASLSFMGTNDPIYHDIHDRLAKAKNEALHALALLEQTEDA